MALPRLLGLSGKAGAGKDTLADLLVRRDGYTKVGFADLLRECLATLNPLISMDDFEHGMRYNDILAEFGYADAKAGYPEFRRLLQVMGTDVGRNLLGTNLWVEATLRRLDPGQAYVFTDVRFENEVAGLHEAGGKVARIERPNAGLEGAAADHPSETALDNFDFKYFVQNFGTPDDMYEELFWQFRRNDAQ